MRRISILVAIFLLILVGVGLYFFLQPKITTSTDENSVTDFFSSLFPFGNNGGEDSITDGTPGTGGEENTEIGTPAPVRQISMEMVSGARFINVGSSTPLIRFVERKSGHVYDMPADSYTATRITNTTVPGIHRVTWLSDTTLLLQSLSTENTPENFLGRISTTTQTLSGTPLSGFARSSVKGDGTLVLATERDSGVLVETARADGSARQTLFASPLRSWVPLAGGGKVFLQTAPSATTPGFLYELNSGTLTKIVGDVNGLMALVSPSGRYVAYSALGGTVFRVIDIEKKNFYEIPVRTMATKCAWVPKKEPALICGVPNIYGPGSYPDDWLLGKAVTTDALWYIDPIIGSADTLVNPSANANTPVDVTNLTVDATGSYALFINKIDLSLWNVQLQGN